MHLHTQLHTHAPHLRRGIKNAELCQVPLSLHIVSWSFHMAFLLIQNSYIAVYNSKRMYSKTSKVVADNVLRPRSRNWHITSLILFVKAVTEPARIPEYMI